MVPMTEFEMLAAEIDNIRHRLARIEVGRCGAIPGDPLGVKPRVTIDETELNLDLMAAEETLRRFEIANMPVEAISKIKSRIRAYKASISLLSGDVKGASNEAEVFAARQANRKHREWLEREAARATPIDPEIPFALPSDCWGFEVTPPTGVML